MDVPHSPSKKQKVSGKTEEADLPKPKPLKICDVQRTKRIGVVAATLNELRTKIQTQINPTSKDFEVVLEEDCTRVKHEDYFQTLADNTVIMVVDKGERWTEGTCIGNVALVYIKSFLCQYHEFHGRQF